MLNPQSFAAACLLSFAFACSCDRSPAGRSTTTSSATALELPAAATTQPGEKPISYVGGGDVLEGATAITAMEELIARRGKVRFLSFGGRWIGMDGDSEIVIFAGRKVEMTEFGVGVQTYQGTYTIADGTLVAHFPTYPGQWPKMVIARDPTSFLLDSAAHHRGIPMGGRGGFTVTPDQPTFFPMRSVE
jgi:hypothetical protein